MSDVNVAKATETVCVVSNISDTVFKVLKNVAGNDISSTINGSKISRELLTGLIHNRIRSHKLS